MRKHPAHTLPRCEVTSDCPIVAAVSICIGGTYSEDGPAVYSCRRHRGIVIDNYLSISNDVRIRKAL